ncbi:TPA: hypothetical protein TY768_000943 [Streptococcus suis]|nr:hypothetical protein [Streptococcus suis]
MIINTSQVEMVLSNKAISAYALEAETGVSRDTISKFRRGLVSLENIKLKTLMQIQEWIDEGNFKISYDYSELIDEIRADIDEGLLDEYIYIVRGNFIEALGTSPVIDYYYSSEEIEEGDIAEKVKTAAVLAELEFYNQIV